MDSCSRSALTVIPNIHDVKVKFRILFLRIENNKFLFVIKKRTLSSGTNWCRYQFN